jgi:CelD/BcsL family acetyltransferase involved in cellulose biosynthesis
MLEELNPVTDSRWDEFVLGNPEGTVYHHSAWQQVLAETYGYTPLYLAATSSAGNQISGILPLMFVNSFLTGRHLVSLPFTTYCNPLIPETLLEEAMHFAFNRFPGVRYLQLKLLEGEHAPFAQRGVASTFVSQVLSLDWDIDKLFLSFHPSSVRQRVRRAEKLGLAFRLSDEESGMRQFYRLHALVRRNHGLPPQPYAFFGNMRRILGRKNLLEVPVVEFEGNVTSAAVLLKGSSTWHLEYSACDSRFLRHGCNQLLIWKCIEMAYQAGAKYFDFGRTSLSQSSLLEFKERWKAKRRAIRYYYFPQDPKATHPHSYSDGLMVRLNRRLPLSLLRLEGWLIYRHTA